MPLCMLTELVQFGPTFLSEQEYQRRLSVLWKEYYQILAEGLLQLRGKKYWEFHKNWLRMLGVRMSWSGLLAGFCGAAINGLSHPFQALKSLTRWWPQAPARMQSKAAKR